MGALSPVNHEGLNIRAENKLQRVLPVIHSTSVSFCQTATQFISTISERKPRKKKKEKKTVSRVLEPTYNPQALNTGTCP